MISCIFDLVYPRPPKPTFDLFLTYFNVLGVSGPLGGLLLLKPRGEHWPQEPKWPHEQVERVPNRNTLAWPCQQILVANKASCEAVLDIASYRECNTPAGIYSENTSQNQMRFSKKIIPKQYYHVTL